MIEFKMIWQNIKILFGVIFTLVGLIIISYFPISYNHDYYNFTKYLNFVGTVAIICFFLNIAIIGITYWLSSEDSFLDNLDKVSNYSTYIFAIGFIGVCVFCLPLLVFKEYSWLEFFGRLLVWGFFLNLYFIISFRLFKKMRKIT